MDGQKGRRVMLKKRSFCTITTHCRLILTKQESGQKRARRQKEAEGPIAVLWEERLWALDRQCPSWVGLGREVQDGSHCPARIPLFKRVERSLSWRILKQRLCFCLLLLGMLERRVYEVSQVPSLHGI